MLDIKIFLQGINYLKANYINWGFDINNDLQIKVWFKKFSNLEPNVFMGLVEKYTELNKYAPNSPADLLEVLRVQLIQKELGVDEAWAYLEGLLFKYPYDYKSIYKELEDKPALYKTFNDFENELHFYRNQYTITAFKKAYEKNLQNEINKKTCMLTGSDLLFLS